MLAAIANRTINPGATVTFTNSASDADVPAQTLAFSLLSAPSGATLTPDTGVFNWRAPIASASTANPVSVVVADSGTPS